jgi:hypothetical protein
MKHYYDPGVDDCPIHEDSDVEHMYELTFKFPIGYSFDFPSWKAADKACFGFVKMFEEFVEEKRYAKDGVLIEANLTHVGRDDRKMCGKNIRKFPNDEDRIRIMDKWLL